MAFTGRKIRAQISYKKILRDTKSVAELKRKAWEKELAAKRGEEWLNENKAMLDAQWKYISSLDV